MIEQDSVPPTLGSTVAKKEYGRMCTSFWLWEEQRKVFIADIFVISIYQLDEFGQASFVAFLPSAKGLQITLLEGINYKGRKLVFIGYDSGGFSLRQADHTQKEGYDYVNFDTAGDFESMFKFYGMPKTKKAVIAITQHGNDIYIAREDGLHCFPIDLNFALPKVLGTTILDFFPYGTKKTDTIHCVGLGVLSDTFLMVGLVNLTTSESFICLLNCLTRKTSVFERLPGMKLDVLAVLENQYMIMTMHPFEEEEHEISMMHIIRYALGIVTSVFVSLSVPGSISQVSYAQKKLHLLRKEGSTYFLQTIPFDGSSFNSNYLCNNLDRMGMSIGLRMTGSYLMSRKITVFEHQLFISMISDAPTDYKSEQNVLKVFCLVA